MKIGKVRKVHILPIPIKVDWKPKPIQVPNWPQKQPDRVKVNR